MIAYQRLRNFDSCSEWVWGCPVWPPNHATTPPFGSAGVSPDAARDLRGTSPRVLQRLQKVAFLVINVLLPWLLRRLGERAQAPRPGRARGLVWPAEPLTPVSVTRALVIHDVFVGLPVPPHVQVECDWPVKRNSFL